MKKGLRLVVVAGIVLSLMFGGWSMALAAAGKAQTTCPVMGAEINKEVYTDYQGKRIYFCCSACIPEFKKDPDKYLKKLQAEGVELPAAGKK